MTVIEKKWKGPESPATRTHQRITEVQSITLKDGTPATLYPIYSTDVSQSTVSDSLIDFLHVEFNEEIERGDTYPYLHTLTREGFLNYFFDSFTAILLPAEVKPSDDLKNWDEVFLGMYYIKPNYAGRCSHNCNGGFLVNHRKRGLRIGSELGRSYLEWAPMLGYTYSVFNLVFETNHGSLRIWDGLGFDRIGRIPGAGALKGQDKPVDAIMFGKSLV
ncbi:hypothetical protein WICPIJ_008816 [Wickerhamomyces pijperi]|uniref:N-acetyltransferase domain-containing protein n=1 Tax=Wickerhamomyces pijperi TaxID=599730 RepID=A0A9P8THE0_WICPI|nr:hypothetical protein WICPIJ_008816 [Wickerhamomyces pijperi]